MDGAIHAQAGPRLREACKAIRPRGVREGEVVTTHAFNLNADKVIHAVGPRYDRSKGGSWNTNRLKKVWERTVNEIVHHRPGEVVTGGISNGAFGYPLDVAADTMLDALERLRHTPTTVTICCFQPDWLKAVTKRMQRRQRERHTRRR